MGRIHIGIDRYSDGDNLTVCEADARAYQRLFGGSTLLSEAAGVDAATLAIQDAVSAGPGWCVVTYSGHGSWAKDDNGDEPDKREECLVCTDGYGLWDDDLRRILWRHPKSSPVLFIADCCHAQTNFRGRGNPPGLAKFKRPEAVNGAAGRWKTPTNRQDNIPGVLHVYASLDKQVAYEGDNGHGLLTEALLAEWDPACTIRDWLDSACLLTNDTGWQTAGYNGTADLLSRPCRDLLLPS